MTIWHAYYGGSLITCYCNKEYRCIVESVLYRLLYHTYRNPYTSITEHCSKLLGITSMLTPLTNPLWWKGITKASS